MEERQPKALKRIIVGPAADREKACQFAQDCLQRFQTEVVPVTCSAIRTVRYEVTRSWLRRHAALCSRKVFLFAEKRTDQEQLYGLVICELVGGFTKSIYSNQPSFGSTMMHHRPAEITYRLWADLSRISFTLNYDCAFLGLQNDVCALVTWAARVPDRVFLAT